jgi:hypothetical protein
MRYGFFLVILLCGTSCSSHKIAPISGRVTVDGQPGAKLRVVFSPIGTSQNYAPGPPSVGYTDEDGRFTLMTMDKDKGALVGPCRVSITVMEVDDDRIGQKAPKSPLKQLPARYNDETTLQFDVPAKGTTEANFELSWK